MARHLITSALPYINGIKHLGNLVGSQLPADLYARYLRGRGHEVMFICATDEHGTPAELAAKKAGKPVAVYCAEMHAIQADIARNFGLSFDHFGRSSSERNHVLTQHFAGKLDEAGLIREVSESQVYSPADGRFLIEHPTGAAEVLLRFDPAGDVVSAGTLRTARKLFDGRVFSR